jgi:hypothetical protein
MHLSAPTQNENKFLEPSSVGELVLSQYANVRHEWAHGLCRRWARKAKTIKIGLLQICQILDRPHYQIFDIYQPKPLSPK